ILGRPVSRESAVFLLMVWEVLTLIVAIIPAIAVIGSLIDGWAHTWSTTETVLTLLVAVFVAIDIWAWRAIHWMDRHAIWPADAPWGGRRGPGRAAEGGLGGGPLGGGGDHSLWPGRVAGNRGDPASGVLAACDVAPAFPLPGAVTPVG